MLLEFPWKRVPRVLATSLNEVESLLSMSKFIVLILFVPLMDLIFFHMIVDARHVVFPG